MISERQTIVTMKFGSHLYGLNTPKSDTDYAGIFLPTPREILLHNYPKTLRYNSNPANTKNTQDDVDETMYALPYFIELALKGETIAIDMLHCEKPIMSNFIWNDLRANRTKFYSKDMKAFIGYVKRQAAKYGIKGSRINDIKATLKILRKYYLVDPNIKVFSVIPEIKASNFEHVTIENQTEPDFKTFIVINGKKYQDTVGAEHLIGVLEKVLHNYGARAKLAANNEGIDWKAVSHALRAGYQCRDIFQKGDFKYPLEETDFLLKVKQGELNFLDNVQPILEDLVKEVETLADTSDLPEKADKDFWDSWLITTYRVEFSFYR